MRNAGLEAQAGIKIAGRNLNHLRYADDTTLTQRAARRQAATGDSDWDILGPPEGGTPPCGLVSPGADPLFSVPLQGSSQALASCFVSHIT